MRRAAKPAQKYHKTIQASKTAPRSRVKATAAYWARVRRGELGEAEQAQDALMRWGVLR